MARKLITVDSSTNELPADSKFATGGYIETQVDEKISGKQDAGNYVLTSDSRLTDTRTPKTHTHAIADVTNLQTTLDGKQASGSYATTSALTTGLAGKANTSHNHTIADVTGLQAKITDLEARLTSLETPA